MATAQGIGAVVGLYKALPETEKSYLTGIMEGIRLERARTGGGRAEAPGKAARKDGRGRAPAAACLKDTLGPL